ncbi:secondary metabolite protein [Streptomyces sp. NPDC056909]|uniref:secondary metabolite protein n=1 Tax=Streptomyces sp. NPDC056909 TaxID=3345963 RepID=UPI00367560CC
MTGRSLVIEPADALSTELCGMWVRTVRADYVFYDPRTSPAHQDHICAHEFGHILRGHRLRGPSADPVTRPVAERLVSTLDPSVVRMMLGRTGYEHRDEQEAELIASLLMARIHRRELSGPSGRVARTLLMGRRSR